MKILMTKSYEAPEYLDDALFHGLRSLGEDVVDSPRLWHMYSDSFGPNKKDLSSIVGKGFTMYGMLDDDGVDRDDIETKIRVGYFDLIIMHSWYLSPYHELAMHHTPKHKIVWIDGRDERQILHKYIGTGWYFKRELVNETIGVKPISFAFPEEKIQQPLEKIRPVAPCVAGDLSTYIFNKEEDYYKQYNESLIGITKCKQGWDCMRHYEIMGARSVPWFIDLAYCPVTTCTTLPKDQFRAINNLLDNLNDNPIMHGPIRDQYDEIRNNVHEHFIKNCTTKALGKYVIDATRLN